MSIQWKTVQGLQMRQLYRYRKSVNRKMYRLEQSVYYITFCVKRKRKTLCFYLLVYAQRNPRRIHLKIQAAIIYWGGGCPGGQIYHFIISYFVVNFH